MRAPFLRVDGDDLILAVRLTPRAAKESVGGLWQDEKGVGWLAVVVRAVPEKGRANAAAIGLIAKRLALPVRDVVLESGETARFKRFRLTGWARDAGRIMKELDGQ